MNPGVSCSVTAGNYRLLDEELEWVSGAYYAGKVEDSVGWLIAIESTIASGESHASSSIGT
jgi:hypothetical protein